eukprot:12576968-Alexandrium_andersonii.AAC.1
MPRDSQNDQGRAAKMRVERNAPVIQAEFGQADRLDAASEVIRIVLRSFGSVSKVLPLLKDLASGYRGDGSNLKQRSGEVDHARAAPAVTSRSSDHDDMALGRWAEGHVTKSGDG